MYIGRKTSWSRKEQSCGDSNRSHLFRVRRNVSQWDRIQRASPRCSQEAPVRPEVMFHYLHRKLLLLIHNNDALSPFLWEAVGHFTSKLNPQDHLGVSIYACPLKFLNVVDTVLFLQLAPFSTLKCSLLGWDYVAITWVLAQSGVNTCLSPCYLK